MCDITSKATYRRQKNKCRTPFSSHILVPFTSFSWIFMVSSFRLSVKKTPDQYHTIFRYYFTYICTWGQDAWKALQKKPTGQDKLPILLNKYLYHTTCDKKCNLGVFFRMFVEFCFWFQSKCFSVTGWTKHFYDI